MDIRIQPLPSGAPFGMRRLMQSLSKKGAVMSPFFASTDIALPPMPTAIACPVCGGSLVELRGLNRCARCQYTICQSCDGERTEPVEDDAGDW